MQNRGVRRYVLVAAVAAVFFGALGTATAQTTNSENYRATETQFGSGSGTNNCSGEYCARISIGDNVVGTSSSENYRARFGPITSSEPILEVITEDGEQDLGVLDIDRTATATRIVKVRTYLSSGYIIQLSGATPGQGTHELTPISGIPSTSHQGAEQFGVNLVANTEPEVGANPVQVPSSTFSYGYVTDDYETPNLFKYINGDIVARSDSSSGQTEYTVSIIINVSSSTPSGRYNGSFSAVVVPVY